jgi:hypothetical protein
MEMKRIVLFLASAALVIAAASCNKVENPVEQSGEGEYTEVTFNVNVDGVDVQTRAAGNLTGSESENKLTTVDILVFEHSSGKMAAYKQYDANQISADGGMTMKLKTDVSYTIYAFANAALYEPENITDESSLLEQELYLSSDNRNINDDYGLCAMSDAIVKAFTDDNMTLDITVKRIAARIRLVNVTNNLPAAAGDVTIKSVFLSNVAGSWGNVDNYECSIWYNTYGRVMEVTGTGIESAGEIEVKFPVIGVDGAAAELSFVTFKSITDVSLAAGNSYTSPVSLYCYANNSENVPDGFGDPLIDDTKKADVWRSFDGQHTMLVVETEIGGETYYYPIDLNKRIVDNAGGCPGIERNKTYDVSLTINNYGSPDEPNREISTLTAGYTVEVGEWGDGGTIDADF